MSIHFFYDEIRWRLPKAGRIRNWVSRTSLREGFTISQLNVIFVADSRILEINQEFLGHDYYTDIITFDYSSDNDLSGELYISVDMVRNNARGLGVKIEKEIQRVIIHGVLHLCGYGDKTEEESKTMREKENLYLLDLEQDNYGL